jgi:formylglycine-generating enzyme required for sulfatase activity
MSVLASRCSAEGLKRVVFGVHVRVSSRFREASRWRVAMKRFMRGKRSSGKGMSVSLKRPGLMSQTLSFRHCQPNRADAESQHRVRITAPYYLGMYEVTQSEYAKAPANPSPTKRR